MIYTFDADIRPNSHKLRVVCITELSSKLNRDPDRLANTRPKLSISAVG